jgi:thiosulfate/3-mercaptopyruvate sulfurtransferase
VGIFQPQDYNFHQRRAHVVGEPTLNVLQHSKIAAIALISFAFSAFAFQATTIPHSQSIEPEELVKTLNSKGQKPLLIHVGFHVLYLQAHIPNSEYIGPASDAAGLERLRARAKSLPRDTFVVIYCGCCPWDHCPNVKPAHDALVAMGFTNIKVLHFADNIGTNWRDKGYPTTKGE